MKAAPFAYRRAREVAEATALLGEAGFEGKAIAGGQSLMAMMNLRLAQPSLLVDISEIRALARIERRDDGVFLGAALTHANIEDGALSGRLGEIMAGVAGDIAYRAVRNRGTIGGSLAHGDPAADWPAALLALGAMVVIAGANAKRTVALEDFQRGAFWVALELDEIIEGVTIPEPGAEARWAYGKYCRKPGEFAEAIGAVLHDPSSGATRVVIGATSSAPRVLAEGAELLGADLGRCREVVSAAEPGLDDYELQLHAVMLRRALAEVAP